MSISSIGKLAELILAKLAPLLTPAAGIISAVPPGTDGMAISGTYSHFDDAVFLMIVDSVSPDNGFAYDTFIWTKTSNGATSTPIAGVPMSPTYSPLSDGIEVGWVSATGHSLAKNYTYTIPGLPLMAIEQIPWNISSPANVAAAISQLQQYPRAGFLALNSEREDPSIFPAGVKPVYGVAPSDFCQVRIGIVLKNADLDVALEQSRVMKDAIEYCLTDRIFPTGGAFGYSGRFYSGKTFDQFVMTERFEDYIDGCAVQIFTGQVHVRSACVPQA